MNFVLDNRVQTFDLKGESCKRFTFLFALPNTEGGAIFDDFKKRCVK